jgi:WhiB family transcriptional regulator, redox-sensing transcriptional regulator
MTRVSPYAESHATTTEIVEDWRDSAACKDADPELFFGPDGERTDSPERIAREAEAKTFCRRCVSRAECLDAVLVLKPAQDAHGIRGGLDAKERATLRKRKAATP